MKYNVIDILTSGQENSVAVIDEEHTLTRHELKLAIANFALEFNLNNILNPSETVICLFDDSIDLVVCFLGIIYQGFSPCNLNPNLPLDSYEYYITNAHAKCIFVSSKKYDLLREIIEKHKIPVLVVEENSLEKYPGNQLSKLTYGSFNTNLDSPMFYGYTSGTSGQPLLAMHTHGDIEIMVNNYAISVLNITEQDTLFTTSKMYFAYGLNNLLIALYRKATAIISPSNLAPENIWEIISENSVTVFFSVPSQYRKLYEAHVGIKKAVSLRLCVSAGEKLPFQLYKEWNKKYNKKIIDGIGCTETLSTYISNIPDKIIENSTGKLVPGFLAQIKDDYGNTLDHNEIGILWLKGNTYHNIYLDNDNIQRERFVNGWFKTNDLFSVDESSVYYYHGRVNDLIYKNGVWINPLLVEQKLNTLESINESVVAGVNAGSKGVLLLAHITLKNGANIDSITDELNVISNNVKYSIEEKINIFHIVNSLPRTSTGKIIRNSLFNSKNINKEIIRYIKNNHTHAIVCDYRNDNKELL